MNRLRLYVAMGLWVYLSISALSQDSWIVAALIGAVCAVMGIVVALSTWTERNLRQAKTAAAYIMVSGLGLILYAFIDRFVIGWRMH
jgi:hypothetical protein